MLYRFLKKQLLAAVYTRADDTGAIFYFTAADFPGLNSVPYTVHSSCGHDLKGYFYSYPNHRTDRLIVFEHGMGSGHTGYMKEIERLCAHGFLVFAYDHTGCMESGGADTGGFAQSVIDCRDVISALKADNTYAELPISVVGHSWGGLSSVNIAAFHPDVTHIVAIAPPMSAPALIEHLLPPMLSRYAKRLSDEERAKRPDIFALDARESLTRTNAHILILHSVDDPTVSAAHHFFPMKEALDGRSNIRFELMNGKAHNPNYTADAVQYKDAFFAAYQRALKKKQLTTAEQKTAFKNSYDWNRMTEQDDAVWNTIFEVLDLPVSPEAHHAE